MALASPYAAYHTNLAPPGAERPQKAADDNDYQDGGPICSPPDQRSEPRSWTPSP